MGGEPGGPHGRGFVADPLARGVLAGSGRASLQVVRGETRDDGASGTVRLDADASGEYAIAIVDGHGLTNRDEPRRRVIVQPDAPPSVALSGMEGLDEAKTDDTLRVDIHTSDDVAVASVELHYTVERSSASPSQPTDSGKVTGEMKGLETPEARGSAALSLERLGLMPGDVLSYRVRVTDNRPAPRGPNVVWAEPRTLTLVEKTEPLSSRRSQLERANIQEKLNSLKQAAATTRRETEPLRYAADAVQRGNGVWDDDRRQALARREDDARALVESLQAFARDLADHPVFQPLARSARQVAELEAEAARGDARPGEARV